MLRRVVLAIAAAVTLAGCACDRPAEKLLTVTLHAQQTSMWCWAASGQMVMEFLGHTVSQATQANNRFGRTDCTNSPIPSACVNGGWPEFDKYNFSFNRTSNAALTWAQVREQIACKNKPFAFSWHWTGGGGHMMVVAGYKTQDSVDWVFVNDPWAPNVGNASWKTYSNYVSGSDHTHWDDFYDVTYTGS